MRNFFNRPLRAVSPVCSGLSRPITRLSGLLSACAALIAFAAPEKAAATESAFGRYIPGLYAGPGTDIVPPAPGFYWATTSAYYTASASKALSIPLGRTLQTEVKATYLTEALSAVWVPDLKLGEGVTIGFGISVPFSHLGISAGGQRLRVKDNSDSIGDIVLMPFMLGYQHEGHFLSFSVSVTAPTGAYKKGDLANVGLNVWTFTPTVAYMYVNPENHLEFSTVMGVDFNTKNYATDYTSGALFHIDATLLRTFESGFSAGVFGSILYQLENDRGELADKLDGFKGRSFAIGPMIRYTHGKGLDAVNVSLNWAPEFGVKNRLKGNAVYLNASGRF